MDVSDEPRGVRRFGIFEADLDARELRKAGARIQLQCQPFQVLSVLLLRAGQLVTRDELRHELWPKNTFVEFDHALNTAVKKIRHALGDDANCPRYIETIPKRGYRFIAPVQAWPESRPSSPGAHGTSSGASVPTGPHQPSESDQARSFSGRARDMALGMFVAIAALVGVLSLYPRHPATAAARRVMIAVLPLESSDNNLEGSGLCDGITQELITQLGRSDPARLGVVARANVLGYRKTLKGLTQVGRELRADYVMEGNVRRNGSHLRVSAELIRVTDQARVWGDDFDQQENGDGLTVETDLAKSITARIHSLVRAGFQP
jgi:TolB-like protein/DNA-binding winged helix-turn-helix (wHTH) protein